MFRSREHSRPLQRNMFSEKGLKEGGPTAQKVFVTGFIGRCELFPRDHSEFRKVNFEGFLF